LPIPELAPVTSADGCLVIYVPVKSVMQSYDANANPKQVSRERIRTWPAACRARLSKQILLSVK